MEANDGRLGISLSLKRARVRIYRDVFRALGEPGCFRFLIDEETNRLAMQVCSFGDAGFHVAPDYYDKDPGWSFEITSLELLELIWEQCDGIKKAAIVSQGYYALISMLLCLS